MNRQYTVQNLLFNPDGSLPEELFCRGDYRYERGKLTLEKGKEVSFNTYFNSFSAAQWKKYTELEKIRFRLKLCGTGRVQVWRTDSRGHEKPVEEVPFSLEKETDFFVGKSLSLNRLGSVCWLKLLADEGSVCLSGGSVLTETEPTQELKIACCFCTYKREKEICRNVHDLLEGISSAASVLNGKVDIYVADNGHTLTPDDFGNSEHVFLFENRNYGGSSGFTRCLMEAGLKKKGRYSHLILMDDDALIRSSVLERTAWLLSFLKPEYQDHMIGGALLSLQQPWLQAENGAEFRNRGVVLNRDRVDLRDFHNVLINQKRIRDVNYNAWFFSCIPAAFLNETNLPMPFFIHGDDIEYGLRFHRKIITANGICIWHPDPTTSRRANMGYYDHRNYSIIEAIHWPNMTAEKYWLTQVKKIMRLIAEYRYETAWYSIRGTRDFLKGVDWFREQDPEGLNRSILNWKQLEKCHVENAAALLEKPLGADRIKKAKKLINLLLPATVERRVYDTNVTWLDVDHSRTKEICIVDPATGDGIVFRRDRERQKELLKELGKLRRDIFRDYDRAAKDWRDRAQEVRSEDFWRQYLGL